MKKYLLIICLVLPLVLSCRPEQEQEDDPYYPPSTLYSIRYFNAHNFISNRIYTLRAQLLAEGTYCNVYAERPSIVTEAQARRVAAEYDNNIYSKMLNAFSLDEFEFNGETFSNVMEFADWWGDEDGKLAILLLDILDDFSPDYNETYIAGYFWPGDFDGRANGSNVSDMIYIDINPGINRPDALFSTLAHEMQHLMNYITSIVVRSEEVYNNVLSVNYMDLWIDEGLAEAAEWVYSGEPSEDRISWYNADVSELIHSKGNNFFVWENRENESNLANLDDYATVNLFFQWLRLQAGSESIYREIITSSEKNYNAVTNAIDAACPGNGFSDWKTLLKTWLAANHINDPESIYGYKGEITLEKHAVSEAGTSVFLYPGEGVYSLIPAGFTMPATGTGNIRYTGLNNTSPVETAVEGNTLLTFNANTNNSRSISPEAGITAGASAGTNSARFIRKPAGPYRIDAFFRQNGAADLLNLEFLLMKNRIHE
ncbi:MAG: hypothetical protein LBH16_06635 [Treponema sp.]|jgi:hypothetical protein|nr:hypothetical protein [Treponema sp.]